LCGLLCAPGCDSTEYDFGQPIDTDIGVPDGAVCDQLPVVDAGCGAVGIDAGCLGAATLETVRTAETIGCAPAGQSLGVLALGAGVEKSWVDLYAWAAPAPDGGPLFDESVSLEPFADDCDNGPLDGECDYRPWVVRINVELDVGQDVFLHVQTGAPRVAVPVGYQLQDQSQWGVKLLAPDPLSYLALDRYLANHPPWSGDPQPLDLTRMPPPLNGIPWICGGGSAGWRQAGYLLHNGTDDERRITRIRLQRATDGEPVPFHFAFYRVPTAGELDPGLPPEASSCHDEVEHPSKNIDLPIVKWEPGQLNTEYALVLQVPPTAGTAVQLILDSETVATSTEKH
jgi:hypothetical protein